MKTTKEAKALAKIMIDIGAAVKRKVVVVISAMHQPLGLAVGNSLEVKEAIDTLKGKGPRDLTDLCYELGGHMLMLAKKAKNHKEAVSILKKLIKSGKAFEQFESFVAAQDGDIKMVRDTKKLPLSKYKSVLRSSKTGYVTSLNALDVGLASMNLGAGREAKDSVIDHGAGILLNKKIGDKVKKGEILAYLYSNKKSNFGKAKSLLERSFTIGKKTVTVKPLIITTIIK